jgi:uroporphyrinogen-III synthase
MLSHYPTLFPSPTTATKPSTTPAFPSPAVPSNDTANDQTLPPLLFLVGEKRRDIIPRTLTSPSLRPDQRIPVDELVVYETGVMESFPSDLDTALRICESQTSTPTARTNDAIQIPHSRQESPLEAIAVSVIVIVIFSPSGCRDLLHRLDLLDDEGSPPPAPQQHPPTIPLSSLPPPPPPSPLSEPGPQQTNPPQTINTRTSRSRKREQYIIATIGPTTYNYLHTEFAFEADVCAETPSPEGVGEGVLAFLRGRGGRGRRVD